MYTLTNVARNLSTNSTRIREACQALNIRIKKLGDKNYIEDEDYGYILNYIRQNREDFLSTEELDERLRTARQYKKVACGDDFEVAYARFSGISDIYIYRSGDTWICQGCRLRRRHNVECKTLTLLKNHIDNHMGAGHKVPYFTTERIELEIQNGKDVWGYDIEPNLL